jgi:hypothetical protein
LNAHQMPTAPELRPVGPYANSGSRWSIVTTPAG